MSIKHHLKEKITIEPAEAADGNGRPTYGTGVACRTRYVQKQTAIKDPQGVQIISQGRLVLGPTTTISPQDRVTLPDGDKTIIIAVKPAKNGAGKIHHKVAYI